MNIPSEQHKGSPNGLPFLSAVWAWTGSGKESGCGGFVVVLMSILLVLLGWEGADPPARDKGLHLGNQHGDQEEDCGEASEESQKDPAV